MLTRGKKPAKAADSGTVLDTSAAIVLIQEDLRVALEEIKRLKVRVNTLENTIRSAGWRPNTFHRWMDLPRDIRVHMLGDVLTLPAILNLRATCKQIKMEQDDAYASGKFKSFGFDAYRYRSVEEVEGMMNTRVLLKSFHFELEGLSDGENPLHKMCANNKPAIARLLITTRTCGINSVGSLGQTPLFLVAREGHVEVVKLLLAHEGIAVNQADDFGRTPLNMAAGRGHVEVVKLLLAHEGITMNQADGVECPLNEAAFGGHVEVVKLLLAHEGIAVNQAGGDGQTPLSAAARRGHVEVARLLQERNAY